MKNFILEHIESIIFGLLAVANVLAMFAGVVHIDWGCALYLMLYGLIFSVVFGNLFFESVFSKLD